MSSPLKTVIVFIVGYYIVYFIAGICVSILAFMLLLSPIGWLIPDSWVPKKSIKVEQNYQECSGLSHDQAASLKWAWYSQDILEERFPNDKNIVTQCREIVTKEDKTCEEWIKCAEVCQTLHGRGIIVYETN